MCNIKSTLSESCLWSRDVLAGKVTELNTGRSGNRISAGARDFLSS